MSRAAIGRFLAGVAGAALGTHLLVAALAVPVLYAVSSHRIFDVRQWSGNAVENFRLVGTYLRSNAQSAPAPLLVFAGSSVSYGYPWSERFVFSRQFAERRGDYHVLNASIIAADVSGVNDWIVCAAKRNRIDVDALVVEIPVVNTLSYLVNLKRLAVQPPALAKCDAADPDPDYVALTLFHVRGVAWLDAYTKREGFQEEEQTIEIGPVPKDHFASAVAFDEVQGPFARQIAEMLTNARTAAAAVYAFPSPVFTGGLAEAGADPVAVQRQLDAALAACRAVDHVRCIDLSAFYSQRSLYFNFTHLNQAGHRAVADLLVSEIAAAGQRSAF